MQGGGGFLITCFGGVAVFTGTGGLGLSVDGVSANAGAMIVSAAASRESFLNMICISMAF